MVEMSIGWEQFFDELTLLLEEFAIRFIHSNEAYCEYAVGRCGIALRSISGIEYNVQQLLEAEEVEEVEEIQLIQRYSADLVSSLRVVCSLWEDHLVSLAISTTQFSPPIEPSRGGVGRPSFRISPEQVLLLSEMSFSWIQISSLLGISRQTLWRRRREWGLVQARDHDSVNDDEIGRIVRTVRQDHPQIGESILIGIIRGMGYVISRRRIRRAIHAVDPLFTSLRWRNGLVARRPYSVRGPNSLWHIGKCLQGTRSVLNVYMQHLSFIG